MVRNTMSLFLLIVSTSLTAQQETPLRVALIKMPYTGARNVPELSTSPDYLEAGGIADTLRNLGARVKQIATVRLTSEEERDYGEWHRMGLANGHLADLVGENVRAGYLHIGLLGNCTSLIGTLGGLQKSGPGRRPRKVGFTKKWRLSGLHRHRMATVTPTVFRAGPRTT